MLSSLRPRDYLERIPPNNAPGITTRALAPHCCAKAATTRTGRLPSIGGAIDAMPPCTQLESSQATRLPAETDVRAGTHPAAEENLQWSAILSTTISTAVCHDLPIDTRATTQKKKIVQTNHKVSDRKISRSLEESVRRSQLTARGTVLPPQP